MKAARGGTGAWRLPTCEAGAVSSRALRKGGQFVGIPTPRRGALTVRNRGPAATLTTHSPISAMFAKTVVILAIVCAAANAAVLSKSFLACTWGLCVVGGWCWGRRWGLGRPEGGGGRGACGFWGVRCQIFCPELLGLGEPGLARPPPPPPALAGAGNCVPCAPCVSGGWLQACVRAAGSVVLCVGAAGLPASVANSTPAARGFSAPCPSAARAPRVARPTSPPSLSCVFACVWRACAGRRAAFRALACVGRRGADLCCPGLRAFFGLAPTSRRRERHRHPELREAVRRWQLLQPQGEGRPDRGHHRLVLRSPLLRLRGEHVGARGKGGGGRFSKGRDNVEGAPTVSFPPLPVARRAAPLHICTHLCAGVGLASVARALCARAPASDLAAFRFWKAPSLVRFTAAPAGFGVVPLAPCLCPSFTSVLANVAMCPFFCACRHAPRATTPSAALALPPSAWLRTTAPPPTSAP
jgi:hypothetical protein